MKPTRTVTLVIATFALALCAIQGGAAAVPACASTCTIAAASTGYTLPVTIVTSGTNVVWHSTDVSHIQRETSTPLGSPASCFSASAGSSDSDPVTFTISGGVLQATTGSTTTTCANAVAANGNFVLPYHCILHANMNGALVVTPA